MKALTLTRSLVAAATLTAAAALAAPPAPQWTLMELTPLIANSGVNPLGINNRGQVVGYGAAPDPVQVTAIHAIVWDNGVPIDLGRTPTNFPISTARAINDRGTVLGGDGLGVNFTWSDGVWTPLNIPGAAPHVINKFGAIGGTYNMSTGAHGFIYRDGALVDVGTLGGVYSEVDAMNDKGDVVGKSLLADNSTFHPYAYINGVMKDLGTFGGRFGVALGINSHAQVVGAAYDASSMVRAFIYDGSAIRQLFPGDPRQSQALGINDRGTIIGNFASAGTAFVYDNGVLTMLDQIPAVRDAGLMWLNPTAINDRGWITGYGRKGNNFSVGFVLIPK